MFDIFFKKTQLPKGYQAPLHYSKSTPLNCGLFQNTFSFAKVPKDFDVLILGSSFCALTCAALLCRVGKKVLILEKNAHIQSLLKKNKDNQELFDGNEHYASSSESLKKIWKLITDGNIQWVKSGQAEDGWTYDRIALGNLKPFSLRAEKKYLIEDLCQSFPGEEKPIIKYFKILDGIVHSLQDTLSFSNPHSLYEKNALSSFLNPSFKFYAKKSVQASLDKITDNPHLKALLGASSCAHGLAPHQVSLAAHACLQQQYLDGVCYPKGGALSLLQAILSCIEKFGGKILTSAPFKKILIHSNTAYGLDFGDNKKILSPLILSDMGLFPTHQDLISHEKRSSLSDHIVAKYSPKKYRLCLMIHFKSSLDKMILPSSNLWYLPCDHHYQLEKSYALYEKNPLNAPPIAMISFPRAKEGFSKNYFHKQHQAVLSTHLPKDWVEQNLQNPNIKKRYIQNLFNVFFKFYPFLKDDIQDYFLDIELEKNDTLACFGPSHFFETIEIAKHTDYKNLHCMRGDTLPFGVSGQILAGVFCAQEVLGYGNCLKDWLQGRNLIDDLCGTLYI